MHVPPPHDFPPVHAVHAAPPLPHAFVVVPGMHLLPEQQPLGHVVESHGGVTHAPLVHTWFAAVQSEHVPPFDPHDESLAGMHCVPEQQPFGHVAAEQDALGPESTVPGAPVSALGAALST